MSEKTKDELIKSILDAEWEMFKVVPNIGGPAPCQSEHDTFNINRYSQAMTWSNETLKSYLEDLSEAKINNRNLMTEKYGRMMESTSPEEYNHIKNMLPVIDREVPDLVENIINIEIKWQEEIYKKYPHILKSGRPIHSSQDNPHVTSFETYLKAELMTYSLKTLEFYYKDILDTSSKNINNAEISLEYVIKKYGYNSLKDANEKLESAH